MGGSVFCDGPDVTLYCDHAPRAVNVNPGLRGWSPVLSVNVFSSFIMNEVTVTCICIKSVTFGPSQCSTQLCSFGKRHHIKVRL